MADLRVVTLVALVATACGNVMAGGDGAQPGDGAHSDGATTGGDGATGGGGTPIFRMNCGADGEDYPACGFTGTSGDDTRGKFWDRAYRPGAGPEGQGVVELMHYPTEQDAEYYLGWAWDDAPQVPQGETRYLRFKLKLVSPIAWYGYGGPGTRFGEKLVILGDGSGDLSRIVANIRSRDAEAENVILRTERNIEGPPSRMDSDPLAPDVWHRVQLAVRSSSTTSSGDGHLYMWIDGDNASEATPTIESSGDDQIDTYGWGFDGKNRYALGFGFYAQSLGLGGRAAFQVIDFEYDDEFAPTW